MKQYTNEQIVEKCKEIWSEDGPDVSVEFNSDSCVIVTLKQMYEYVGYNLKHLKTLAEFFGTENINDSRYSSPGCETCDYGSSYEVSFVTEPER